MELSKKNFQSTYYMVFKVILSVLVLINIGILRGMLWWNLSLVDKEVNFKAHSVFYRSPSFA